MLERTNAGLTFKVKVSRVSERFSTTPKRGSTTRLWTEGTENERRRIQTRRNWRKILAKRLPVNDKSWCHGRAESFRKKALLPMCTEVRLGAIWYADEIR